MSTQNEEQTRYERIKENCKKIWGADKEFEFDIETDDYEHYQCIVREDYGLRFGSPLVIASARNGPNKAWDELDRMLRLWARQVESGRPMTREEQLEIFSGPHGEHKRVLEDFMNRRDEMDALAAAAKKA
ncbi:uncharacterized protein BDR25DRAFT_368293 [Lindgomyces ingoldianus]|uniref:Uncharacterized protein n=1 Tax=Lindgomyces ingoldianus TaxID=673940 RepID=A0ACB6QXC4_9PLEO|nr:uncharacterized protein BDR25DRAFT_368293 [Lindgomyces ingoldianus]KAF2471452.1 hypothetical protein BDR25DRAFT_368293 [Lindgomyces ingoldianus]